MITPITPTPFTDWCAETLLREETRFLATLPVEDYWPTIDAADDIRGRLEAELSRKVVVRAA